MPLTASMWFEAGTFRMRLSSGPVRGCTISNMDQSRQARRFAVQLPAVHGTSAEEHEGTVLNLSGHGCAMTAKQLPAVADYISVQVDLLDGREPVAVELAAVRWLSDHRCGLEFIRMSPEMTARLKAFIELLERTP